MISFKVLIPLLVSFLELIAAQNITLPTAGSSEDPLLWSTYAPQLYFGIRPRLPQSLVGGLMWLGLNNWQGLSNMHHATSSSPPQEGGLHSYTYLSHIPRIGSTQGLLDTANGAQIGTAFVNLDSSSEGQSWAARVEGKPLPGHDVGGKISPIWYFYLEGEGELLLVSQDDEVNGLQSPIVLLGSTPDLGKFRITIRDHEDTQPVTEGQRSSDFKHTIGKTSWFGGNVPGHEAWRAKDIIHNRITEVATNLIKQHNTNPNPSAQPSADDLPDPAFIFGHSLGNNRDAFGASNNFWGFQKTGVTRWGFDVIYESGTFDEEQEVNSDEVVRDLESKLHLLEDDFTTKFDKVFPLEAKLSTPQYKQFAKEMTANMLGGVGYFHGKSLVAQSYDDLPGGDLKEIGNQGDQAVETKERQLLTATPCRSFFPRGFYWDEGFHLQLIGEWDNDLSLEILRSWVDLIDEDGWVGREQILGAEARSKVPSEFQVQFPTYANPPTLTMAITAFISRLKEKESATLLNSQLGLDHTTIGGSTDASSLLLDYPELARTSLQAIYPALRRHYFWFRSSQKGQLKEWDRKPTSRLEAYRWRGRTNEHVLTSGMDDYPRASPPHVGELHIDLISWMGFFARTMSEIAEYLGEEDDYADFKRNEKNILANIEDLHWSEDDQMYCDVTVDEDDESTFSCHAGYISLFPMMLGLLPPDSPHLGSIFDLIHSPEKLWSDYGLRSLSKDHAQFGKGENYWKGPIWMPFNYLTLSSLYKFYISVEGPYQAQAKQIYAELRDNIISNVFKEHQKTGYVWEQYDALTGEGKRSHPFTGWTSLVTLIMAEKY